MRRSLKPALHPLSAIRGPLCGILLSLALSACRTPSPFAADFAAAAKRSPGKAAVIPNVPPFARTDAQSIAEPLASVLQFWKQRTTPDAIREWCDSGAGTAFAPEDRPVRYAWQADLWAFAARSDIDALRVRVAAGAPVIVLLQDLQSDLPKWRYAIVTGWDDGRHQWLCLDGERRERTISYTDFQQAWGRYRNWMITVCPAEYPTWTLDSAERAGRGQFYENRKQLDRAAADYEAAIAAGFTTSALHVRLGTVYRALQRTADAEAEYRRALALNPRDGHACNNLSYLLAEQSRNMDEAVQLARQAVLLEPTNPLALDTLGFALCQSGQFKEASDVLERARARSRWFPVETQAEIGMHLVWAHHRNGQDHLAREVLRDVISSDPNLSVPPELAPLLKPASGRAP